MVLPGKIQLISIFLFIALLLSGCGVFEIGARVERIEPTTETSTAVVPTFTPTQQATSLPAVEASSTPVATAPAAAESPVSAQLNNELDATHSDGVASIAIDYPSAWSVSDMDEERKATVQNYATTFQSWISGPGGGGGVPAGGTKFDLLVELNKAATPAEAIAIRRAEIEREGSESTLLSAEAVTLPNGLEGTWLRTTSTFGESEQFVTSINGHLITIGGIGDEALIRQIVQTLQPLATAEETFEPYPVRSTDVSAIQIAEGVEMAMVYNGPGENFTPAASVPSGMALAVDGISEDGLWYRLAGCGAQNPYRPAPSCWIAADQSVSVPIRAIAPSQQPVLPTDQGAVLIVAPAAAVVRSGPDASYPMISQLMGGFSFAITGVSEGGNWWRLAECSSPLNEVLDECWISADPAITQAQDALIPHGPQSSAPPSDEGPRQSGATTITELPRCFNLDTGVVGALSNPNCDFNLHPHETAGTLMFEPIAPARFGFGGVFPEPPTAEMCAGSRHLSASGEVIAPLAMLYVCYQTGDGRFGYLHFLEMTDEPLAVTLEWNTFE